MARKRKMKQIKVFSNIYDIHFNNDVEDVHGAYGLHFPKDTKIYIQSGMPEHKEKVIILHELHTQLIYHYAWTYQKRKYTH